MSDPREILRRADALRSSANHARKAAELMSMGGRNRLGLRIGCFDIDQPWAPAEIRAVLTKALTEYADHQEAAAADLDSRVVLR